MQDKLKEIMKEPTLVLRFILYNFFTWLPDTTYVKIEFFIRTRKRLNLKNPQTFNEKLQWLKLYDRNPLYTQLADKYEVRKYIADTIGEQYLVPLLGAWDRFEDIDFDALPNQFVLKCNHDSGSVFICKDKSRFDIRKVGKTISKRLKHDFYLHKREWQYKGIIPRIIAEEYLEDESGALMDYKVLCFNGVGKVITVNFDILTNRARNAYTPKWKFINVCNNYPNNKERSLNKPEMLEEMLHISNKIAALIGSAFVRVDFYYVYGRLYVGELTFTPASGMGRITPNTYNELWGSWIELKHAESLDL